MAIKRIFISRDGNSWPCVMVTRGDGSTRLYFPGRSSLSRLAGAVKRLATDVHFYRAKNHVDVKAVFYGQ